MKKIWYLSIFFGVLLHNYSAQALCLNSEKGFVDKEFGESQAVAIVRVIESSTQSSVDDPEGIDRTIYKLKVLLAFKGINDKDREIEVFSENTSSRFNLDVIGEYLVFLKHGSDGIYIDSCGNSQRVGPDTDKVVARLKYLSKAD